LSGGHGGQLDEGIVAQRCHSFQRHVAGALDGPFDGMDRPRSAPGCVRVCGFQTAGGELPL
jgi:hypothetical protein